MSAPTERDPRPRRQIPASDGIAWPAHRAFAVAPGVPPPPASFLCVAESRRSVRDPQKVALREIANLLAVAQRPSASWIHAGIARVQRPASASGALHAVNVVVIPRGRPRALRYAAHRRRLESLVLRTPTAIAALQARTSAMLPASSGSLLVMVADLTLLEACYEDCMPLAWRDSGVLLQTLHLYATAFRLAFCPLGLNGNEVIEAIFGCDATASAAAVGVAMLGR